MHGCFCRWLAPSCVLGLFSFLVCGSNCESLNAQASIDSWGMPQAIDMRNPGAIVLHGGGLVTDDVFDRFIELAGGSKARIVFVPSAGFRRGWYNSDQAMIADLAHRYSSWAALANQRRVASFQFLFTDDPLDADNSEFVKPIETATGVWFSGGDQLRLNYRFVGEYPRQTRFQKALARLVARGGVVGGTSAGTAAIPEVMTLWDERKSVDSPASIVPGHGLGLLRQTIVEQHFDARGGRLERFTGLLRDDQQLDHLTLRRGAGKQMIGLAVEESSAAVLRPNYIQVLGTGNAHVFLKSASSRSIVWHQLTPGDQALVQYGTTSMSLGLSFLQPNLLR